MERSEPRGSAPSDGLEAMSVEQLQQLLDTHDATLAELHHAVAELENVPSENGARLAHLEHLFSTVGYEDVIRLKSPVLRGIAKVVKDEHQILQEEAAQAATAHQHYGHPAHLSPKSSRVPAAGLALGRTYMPLDELAKEEAEWVNERKKKHHPLIGEAHYAGHMPRSSCEPHFVFMGPSGKVLRKPLPPEPGEDGFWLDRPDEPAPQAPPAVDGTNGSYGTSGTGHDAMPCDWLGMARHGITIMELDEMERRAGTP